MGRDPFRDVVEALRCISIHAPLVGRDRRHRPLRHGGGISIHAPLVGRDFWLALAMLLKVISIHAPLVGRDVSEDVASRVDLEFQSTRPSWGATRGMIQYFVDAEISIHAPLVGRDQLQRPLHDQERHFNPRARVGRDSTSPCPSSTPADFNPRARVGRDAVRVMASS